VIEWLPQIRTVHVSCALASGALFLVRGGPLLIGRPPFDLRSLRGLSYVIDSLLLSAAIGTMTLLQAWPTQQAWLAVKLALVLGYIVLGSLALKRGRTPAIQRASFLAALAVYLSIVAVVRSHDPLGPLGYLGLR
jgi:uncharacterized membrane protein SirB2